MTKNTDNPTSSSPPSFMDKPAQARAKAARMEAQEDAAQSTDDKKKAKATIVKASVRMFELADYGTKVEAAIGAFLPGLVANNPMGEVVDTFAELEDASRVLEDAVKKIKARIDYAREVSLPGRMDSEETKTFTSAESGHRITRTARVFASILSDKVDAAFEWLRHPSPNDPDRSYSSLIKETVNASSLSGLAKELLENGMELPENMFRVHMKDGVSITRGKSNEKKAR